MYLFDNTWSFLVDRSITRGCTVLRARVVSQTMAFIGPSVALLVIIATNISSVVGAITLLTVAVALCACVHSGSVNSVSHSSTHTH